MNRLAILHSPSTGDAAPENGRMTIRLRSAKDDLREAVLVYNDNKFQWSARRLSAPMEKAFSDSEFDYYSATVPVSDTRFAYIFRLEGADGERLYLSEDGLAPTFDHSLAFFDYFQLASQFPGERHTVPSWVDGTVCYQIFPERFAIGLPDKDMGYVNTRWGARPTPRSFCGGDLEGVRQGLDRLEDLGVGLLYLTPVFRSPSNHKYDITDYENVDPAFGGNEALRALIDDAHKRGMRVMLDGVFNHCSWRHPFFLDVRANGARSRYWSWFYVDGERPDVRRPNYRTFASVADMPKLNTSNPEVIEYFCAVASKWMRDYGADCWRLDVSDELSLRFLRAFRETVKGINPDALIIGEDWHQATGCLDGDIYDGTMNYGFLKACLDLLAFQTITPSGFRDRVVRLLHRQSPLAGRKMLNLLDSHDTERFLTRCGGDARRHRAALALQFFHPGFPSVYYGDEIGMEGGYDPDCRRCLEPLAPGRDLETLALAKRLSALRRDCPAFGRGKFAIGEEDGILDLSWTLEGGKKAALRLNATGRDNQGLAPWGFEAGRG